MAIQHANRGIVKSNLQLYYNREFSKSFRGEAAANLIGTYGVAGINSYPSSGNNWGTYSDRLYNGGAYASIGVVFCLDYDEVAATGVWEFPGAKWSKFKEEHMIETMR
jgi:hypothetical protein